MSEPAAMSWPALLALGAGHGINPAMGWLFAVALGFQRRSRAAVWAALGPLAVGHAVAIAAAIALAGLVGLIVPLNLLQWITAGSLVVLGGLRLLRSRHIVYGGMNVDARELAVWSFLMASAHGAGLMVLPFVLGQMPLADHAHHLITAASVLTVGGDWDALLAALIHTGGYLLVTGLVAVIVYERIGLRFLRTAWLNLDLVWSVALVATGVATLVLK
jgi:hypothetical protein